MKRPVMNEKNYTFLLLMAGLVVVLLLYIPWRLIAPATPFPPTGGILIFLAMAAMANMWVLDIPRYGRILMVVPIYYASVLALGPLATAGIIVTSGFLKMTYALWKNRREVPSILRETMWFIISFSIGSTIYASAFTDHLFITKIVPLEKVLGLLLCALVVFMFLHMAGIFERIFTSGLTLRYLLRINVRSIKVHMAMLVPLGLLIETIYRIEPAGLVLLVPVYFMYISLRDYADILKEARATIEDLAIAFESRDPFTRSHSLNVAQIAGEIAREMYLEEEEIDKVISAGKLHDLGKIGIADEILEKGKLEILSFEEYEELRKHPELGHRVTEQLSWYKDEAKYIHFHHEWFDGSGYPRGLRGEEIPLGSRILAAAEAFDAMASPRSYRDSIPLETIVGELKKKRGTQFDPMVIDAFLSLIEKKPNAPGRQHQEVPGGKEPPKGNTFMQRTE
jgi:HD-GYP domain-containing protein (c-di-GMP phosphodiesterase class II)